MNRDEAIMLSGAIRDSLLTVDEENVSDALYSISHNLKYLGNGDAATQMGAIENLAKEIRDGCQSIASSLSDLAEAIRESRE